MSAPVIAAAGSGDLSPNTEVTVETQDYVLIVDTVILSATIIGSSFTLGSMAWLEYKGRPSTTRMRIVQSLVLSDFILGVVGLVGVALALSQKGLHAGPTCDGLGVVLLAVLYSQHLWTMALATATFLILIHPLYKLTIFLEHRWWLLWIVVWTISFGMAVAGLEVTGLVPAGGICYYGSGKPLFGELMQFIPRGCVFVIITVLYVRLFVFLRRPDKIRLSHSGDASDHSIPGALRRASRQSTGVLSSWFRHSSFPLQRNHHKERVVAVQVADPQVEIAPPTPDAFPTQPRIESSSPSGSTPPPSTVPSTRRASADPIFSPKHSLTTEELPPWERVELPAFQIDGQRFGGSSANVPSSSTSLWGNWKGLGGSTHRGKRSSTGGSSASPTLQGSRKLGSFSSWETGSNTPTRRASILTPRLEPISSFFGGEEGESEAPNRQQMSRTSASTLHSDAARKLSIISDTTFAQPTALVLGPLPSVTDRRASAWTQGSDGLLTPNYQPASELPKAEPLSKSDGQIPEERRLDSADDGTPRLLANRSTDPEKADFQMADKEGERDPERQGRIRDMSIEEEEAEWDLMRMLQQGGPSPKDQDARFAPAEGETVELVEESMASYLNRKTALLMLWFPLGYVLLFSVSLIRLIFDFAGKPPSALRAISRWFVFAQGILDAVIYGLVEWHTKRVVRRRVRKGTFSPSTSQPSGSNSWSKMFQRRSQPLNNNHNGSGRGSRLSQSQDPTASKIGQTQTTTFVKFDEPPIQDCTSGDGKRRGSAADSLDC